MDKVKIFGIQRSGNNWLHNMLEANYDVKPLGNQESGWNHGYCINEKVINCKPKAMIILCRHPIVWLPSIWRYRGTKWSFVQHIIKNMEVHNWNKMYSHWTHLHFEEFPVVYMDYMDLLLKSEETCNKLAEGTGIKKKEKPFYVPSNKMTKQGTESYKAFDVSYYTENKFLKYYDKSTFEFVINQIDWTVAAEFGYSKKDYSV